MSQFEEEHLLQGHCPDGVIQIVHANRAPVDHFSFGAGGARIFEHQVTPDLCCHRALKEEFTI